MSLDNEVDLMVGECQHCDGVIVLFNGSTCGPCPHCRAMYGIAQNLRYAGVLRKAWIPEMLALKDRMAVKQ